MDSIMLRGFLDELDYIKLAWGPEEHTYFNKAMVGGMGVPVSPGIENELLKGNLATDTGLRHPWNPSAHELHAFPGQSPSQVEAAAQAKIERGARRIMSKGIFQPIRRAMGFGDISEAAHTVQDIEPHAEVPLKSVSTSGFGIRDKIRQKVRGFAEKHPLGGIAPTAAAGLEHATGGLQTGGPASDLFMRSAQDAMGSHPETLKSFQRSQEMGAKVFEALKTVALSQGAAPEAAEQMARAALSGEAPGAISHLLGRLGRFVRR